MNKPKVLSFDPPNAQTINLKNALHKREKDQWKNAIDEKMQSIINNHTWELVHHPKDVALSTISGNYDIN